VKTPKCKKVSDEELRSILFAKDTIPFEHFYTRIGIDIKTKKQSQWFATSVKLRIDSAFSGTYKILTVIGGTYLITQDSLNYTHKGNKCYFQEGLSYVSSLFGTEVQFDFFQSLLLGRPIGLDPSIEYVQIHDKDTDKDTYILSSHKAKKFRQIEKGETGDEEEILIQYHISCKDFELEKMIIQIPSDTVRMTILYKDKKVESGEIVPNITHITIVHPRDSVKIEINSGVVKIDQPKKIFFKIPEGYIECQ